MAALDWESAVTQIMQVTQCDRAKAEHAARLNGYSPPALDPAAAAQAERDARVLEKAEQLAVTKVFRTFGCKVRSLSQPRPSKQSLGIPDLWCVHRELPIAFWWETKRQVGGEFSEDQTEFRDDCTRTGTRYGSGDRYHAQEYVISLGLAYREHGVLEPVRSSA